MSTMVCPDCGHDEFTAKHVALIERTYKVRDGYADEISEEIIDVEREYDALTCADCGTEWQEYELVAEGHCAECGLHEDDGHLPDCASVDGH